MADMCHVCGGPLRAPAGYIKNDGEVVTKSIQLVCARCGMPHTQTPATQEGAMPKTKAAEAQYNVAGTRNELLEKLRRLDERLAETEGIKKSMAKDYGEQLKDIKAERVAVLRALKDAPESETKNG